jgi:hypothetical protein
VSVPPPTQVRISILRVPDCPSVSRIRADVEAVVRRTGAAAVVEEVEGPYASPTLLIDGIEIDGYPLGLDPACRIDVPSSDDITAAVLAGRSRTSATRPAGLRGGPR